MYCQKGDALYKAIVYARDFDRSLPDGEHEVEGRNIFAKVASYETSLAEERKFESHRYYVDVQVILEGAKCMDVSLEQDLEPLATTGKKTMWLSLKLPQHIPSLP